jgi:hypothetical protein
MPRAILVGAACFLLAAVIGVVAYSLLAIDTSATPPPSARGVGASARSFSDPGKQADWKEALTEAKIPYELERREDGREFVWVAPQYAEAVEKVEDSLWGTPIGPERHNVRFEDPAITEEFRAWLVARGIPHKVYGTKKHPVIGWSGPDDLTLEFMKSRIPAAPADCGKVAAAPAPVKRC